MARHSGPYAYVWKASFPEEQPVWAYVVMDPTHPGIPILTTNARAVWRDAVDEALARVKDARRRYGPVEI